MLLKSDGRNTQPYNGLLVGYIFSVMQPYASDNAPRRALTTEGEAPLFCISITTIVLTCMQIGNGQM